jgi:hypothetical protein
MSPTAAVPTIVCIKWGIKYGPEYVNRLYSMVSRHTTAPHRFLCLTDNPAGITPGIETAPLTEHHLTGWWHKLTLFKSDPYGITGPLLFLDLDVVITGSLDDLLFYAPALTICQDFLTGGYNSSVFLLWAGSRTEVWDEFARAPTLVCSRFAGDQDWITRVIRSRHSGGGAELWPSAWVKSYRVDLKGGPPPPDCCIVVFHGRPKPHDCGGWVRDHWR